MLAVAALADRGHACVRVDMARSGAVSQFGHGVICVAVLLVLAGPIVIGMAGRAVGRIGCVGIADRLRIALVAIIARQLLRMVAGIGR